MEGEEVASSCVRETEENGFESLIIISLDVMVRR